MSHKVKSTVLLVILFSVFSLIALSERAIRLERMEIKKQKEYKALAIQVEREKKEEKQIKKRLKQVNTFVGCHWGIASIQETNTRLAKRLKQIKETRVSFEGEKPFIEALEKKIQAREQARELISRKEED